MGVFHSKSFVNFACCDLRRSGSRFSYRNVKSRLNDINHENFRKSDTTFEKISYVTRLLSERGCRYKSKSLHATKNKSGRLLFPTNIILGAKHLVSTWR